MSSALKAKYSYIAQYDFVLKVVELLKSGAFNNGNFVVSGTVEYNYSIKDNDEGRYYRSFVPTNIYRASDDEVQSATGNVDLYYIKDDVILDACENGDIQVRYFIGTSQRLTLISGVGYKNPDDLNKDITQAYSNSYIYYPYLTLTSSDDDIGFRTHIFDYIRTSANLGAIVINNGVANSDCRVNINILGYLKKHE